MIDKLEKEVNVILDRLLEDYGKGRDIDEVSVFNPPSKEEVVKILLQLRKIIFPGYQENKEFRSYTTRGALSTLLEDLLYNLSKQISAVSRYLPQMADKDEQELFEEAEKTALKFLETIPKIREYVQSDLQASYDGDPAAFNKPEIITSYPGLFAITVNRIAHELYLLGVPVLPRMMTEYAHTQTGIDIHPGATIGKNFFIDHGTGIVIGETTVIGNNVKIYQGVTLGALSTRGGQSLKGKKRHPTIEDNVTVYAGASILGGDTVIGKNSVIGGNVFLTSSVACNTRVRNKIVELDLKQSSPNCGAEDFS